MRVYTIAFWFGLESIAAALPPIAVVESAEDEIVVGVEARFTAAASFDPDDDELTFAWDFDDGSGASGAEVRHVFAEPGAYRVRVVVSDGTSDIEAGVTVFALNPVAESADRSNLLCLFDGSVFGVVHPLGSLMHIESRSRVDVEDTVYACASDATSLWLATDAGIARLDRELRVLESWDLPGARYVATDGRWVVAHAPANGRLWIKDGGSEPSTQRVSDDGGALVLQDGVAWIVRFRSRAPTLTGSVDRIELLDRTVRRIGLAYDESSDTASSGGGVPNLLGAMGIAPDGLTLWIGGTKSNTERGVARDGRMLTPENRVRALLTPVNLATGAEALEVRLDANDAGIVSAIEFSPNGRYAYLAHSGIGEISVYDLAQFRLFDGREPGSTVPFVARLSVGVSVDALLRVDDVLHVRVRETMEHVVLDISDPASPVESSRAVLADDPRPAAVAYGARLFNSSMEPIHSRGGYISCASCHPGGSHDGRTWDFTQAGEGFRNTIDLRGRSGIGHGALHWSGNFDEVQDFENDIVFGFGGSGLAMDGPPHPPFGDPNGGRSEALDALAAYVGSLDRVPDSPRRIDGSVERGQAIFFSATAGCRACHSGSDFTDSAVPPVLHDVGTLVPTSGGRLGDTLTGIDTPTLLGVWQTAPYLHDGRAETLRDVLTTHNTDDRHGTTSHLRPAEIDDVVAYLEALDMRPDRAVLRTRSSEGCSAGRSASLPLLLLLLVPMRRFTP